MVVCIVWFLDLSATRPLWTHLLGGSLQGWSIAPLSKQVRATKVGNHPNSHPTPAIYYWTRCLCPSSLGIFTGLVTAQFLWRPSQWSFSGLVPWPRFPVPGPIILRPSSLQHNVFCLRRNFLVLILGIFLDLVLVPVHAEIYFLDLWRTVFLDLIPEIISWTCRSNLDFVTEKLWCPPLILGGNFRCNFRGWFILGGNSF